MEEEIRTLNRTCDICGKKLKGLPVLAEQH